MQYKLTKGAVNAVQFGEETVPQAWKQFHVSSNSNGAARFTTVRGEEFVFPGDFIVRVKDGIVKMDPVSFAALFVDDTSSLEVA
jgi:hypothetical protein